MKIKTFLLSLLLLTVIHLERVFAQLYEPQLDKLMIQLSETTVGGTVLVAKEGNVLYRKAFGKADLELGVSMEPHHIHRIGSITKQFTAAAILKLQEEGKLSIRDDIGTYIKDYPSKGHTITIEHLLTHTSGIANYTSLSKFDEKIRREDLTPLELIDFFEDEPMDFAPGEKFKYNNSGYVILGHIIELVTGQTYDDYLKKSFFEPLKMKNTRYDNTSEIIADRVSGYSRKNGTYSNAPFLSMTLPYSGGSLISTVDDLFLWNTAVMEHRVLSKETTTVAHTGFSLNQGDSTGYGYGWRLGQLQGSPTIKHGGTVNGFSSYALYLPDQNIYLAILTNCDCTWNIEDIASQMAAIVMDKPFSFEEADISLRQLKAVQGVYRSPYGEKRIIRYEDGESFFFKKGGEKTKLVPSGQNGFRLGKSLNGLEFKKNPKGFTMKGLGGSMKWQKTDVAIAGFESLKLSPKELQKYLGEYRLSQDRIFRVIAEDGRIFGQMGSNREEILPLDTKRFYAKGIDAQLIFDFENDGTVVALTIIQGKPRKAVKIK